MAYTYLFEVLQALLVRSDLRLQLGDGSTDLVAFLILHLAVELGALHEEAHRGTSIAVAVANSLFSSVEFELNVSDVR